MAVFFSPHLFGGVSVFWSVFFSMATWGIPGFRKFHQKSFPKTAKWSDWIYFHDVTKIPTCLLSRHRQSIIDPSIHPSPSEASEEARSSSTISKQSVMPFTWCHCSGGIWHFWSPVQGLGLASGYHSGFGRGPKKSIAGFIYCRCILGDTSIWVCFFRNSEPQNEMTNQGFWLMLI